MSDPSAVQAWLLMTVGENRQHGGNSGYDDQPDVYYTWDSTVPHHASIKVGDPIALWDKNRLLGVSIIEEIETETKDKFVYKCPECHKASIKRRSKLTPRFKCHSCDAEFETPEVHSQTVLEYRSRHDAAWSPLEGLLDGPDLRSLCASPRSQQSMRPLVWPAFQAALSSQGAAKAVERVVQRSPDYHFPQGHRLDIVRVRRGQQAFRDHLLATQGETCAFTGDAPTRVLDAGHLYSYAELGVHQEHGGLLLRRDIHRLFDDGSLAVDPSDLRVDVARNLDDYPQYASLQGQRLRTHLKDSQVEWLAQHWTEHRAS